MIWLKEAYGQSRFGYKKITALAKILLPQAWATSGTRATYGPPSTLMWPASYIWSFLNSYIDYEVIEYHEITCFITKTTLKSVYMDMYWPADT